MNVSIGHFRSASLRVALVGLAAMLMACGCRSAPQRAEPAVTSHRDQRAPVEGDSAVSPGQLMPLRPSAWTMRYVRGDEVRTDADSDAGRLVRFTLAAADDAGRWRYEIEDMRVLHLAQGDDGSVLIHREEDFEEKVTVDYEPALVMFPVEVTAEPYTQTVKMTVRDLERGSVRDSGKVTVRTTYRGTARAVTPAGEFDVHRLHMLREVRLGLAKADVDIEASYAADAGLVLERIDRKTTVLGMFSKRQTEEFRLAGRSSVPGE